MLVVIGVAFEPRRFNQSSAASNKLDYLLQPSPDVRWRVASIENPQCVIERRKRVTNRLALWTIRITRLRLKRSHKQNPRAKERPGSFPGHWLLC